MVPSSKGKIIHHVTKIPKKYFSEFPAPFWKGRIERKGVFLMDGKKIGMHNSVSIMNTCCFGETRRWDVCMFFALLNLSK